MRIIIAGSRTLEDKHGVFQILNNCIPSWPITEVVSGTARGIDKLGEQWAESKGIPVKRFPADWNGPHKKAAGFIRNEEMAAYAHGLIAIWDGKSNGTRDMIDRALNHKLWTCVIVP